MTALAAAAALLAVLLAVPNASLSPGTQSEAVPGAPGATRAAATPGPAPGATTRATVTAAPASRVASLP